MKTNRLLFLAACAGVLGGCAATLPSELVNAREAYRRASTGPAAQVSPAEVHVAAVALAKAEKSFVDNEGSYQTRDLAYVAQRKAELAEVTASIATEQKSQAASKDEFVDAQGRIVTRTKQDLATSEQIGAATAQALSAEQAARVAADQRAADAQAALAKLAAVKEDARGLIITLSGSVLFASNQSALLPAAQERLSQVADVLLANRERNVTVEGHTDSRGSDSANMTLSQGRADSVRSFLVQRGYEPDRMKAMGLGEGRPVADNESAEGRANNRRVEIIIERDATMSSR